MLEVIRQGNHRMPEVSPASLFSRWSNCGVEQSPYSDTQHDRSLLLTPGFLPCTHCPSEKSATASSKDAGHCATCHHEVPPSLRPHHVCVPVWPWFYAPIRCLPCFPSYLSKPSPSLKPQVYLRLQEASQLTPASPNLALLIVSAARPDSWAPLRPRAKT